MDFVLQILFTIFLLAAASLGPGLIVIRYFRWHPMDTLIGAIATSFLFQYLCAFLIYATGRDPSISYGVTAIDCIALILSYRDLMRLWKNRQTRKAILAQLTLFGWAMLLILLVRN